MRQLVKRLLPAWFMIHRLRRSPLKRVLLTFDDGPDRQWTPVILDLLQTYNVRALFFVVAREAEKYPEIIRKIETHGHVVANHSYSHLHSGRTGFMEYRSDIEKAQKILRELSDKPSKLFRPPYGLFNLLTLFSAKSLGLKIVLWANEGGEWSARKWSSSEQIAEHLKNSINDRQILLLHDNNPKTADILETLLPHLRERGYDLNSAAGEVADGL